jgi:hypothetical protein
MEFRQAISNIFTIKLFCSLQTSRYSLKEQPLGKK